MSDWWARKFGEGQPPAPAQAPTPQPTHVPGTWPGSTWQQPPPAQNYPPTTEPGYKQVVTEANYKEAIRDPSSYQGLVTASAKAGDTENCPNCNSPRYYHMTKQSMVARNGMAAPKPRCGDCGWPNLQGPNA